MTTLDRVRVEFSGFPGGPGVATHYFLDVSTAIESLSTFWAAMATLMPVDVHINVPRTGDTIEDTTGKLTGSWIGGVTTPSVGGGAGKYAAPVGFMVGWETGQIMDGHRVRGKSFVVPAESGVFSTDGSLTDGIITNIVAAANTLILAQSTSLVIWHRPFAGRAATPTHPARAAHLGGHALVTGSRVPDKAVVLRSRRD